MIMRSITELPGEAGCRRILPLDHCAIPRGRKLRANILALGDVGATMLIGLRLLGGDAISSIGICDINQAGLARLEMEINQIMEPVPEHSFPEVEIVTEDQLFDCDVFIFCASRGVPGLDSKGDVRMAQLAANREIIAYYGALARKASFPGFVAVVSDPVDPLAKAFLQESGLAPWQIRGFGLGVMNARASYYARKEERFSSYLEEGRVYGPHGQDLVVANSVDHYDDALSRELTELTVAANLKVRELGYKPYIAPALSSAALSILATVRGQWHYGSVYLGDGERGAFLGILSRITDGGVEWEERPVPDVLYQRIRKAYMALVEL